VPTYNHASLLRVGLQATVPQVAKQSDLVEVCVSDNASPDQTREVVDEARSLGPVRYSCNPTNLGFRGNAVNLTTQQARGEYVWLVGDDELLMPDALTRVVPILQAHQGVDAFYVNFRCARFPEHWPESAFGGYDGPYEQLGIRCEKDRHVPLWQDLLTSESCLCTHMYAHIVRRRIWVEYWEGRVLGPDGMNLHALYPHNVMFGETLMRRPSYYIGRPALTMFHGAQSFIPKAALIMAIYYPQVLRFYQRKGLAGKQLRECEQGLYSANWPLFGKLLGDTSRSSLRDVLAFIVTGWRYRAAWTCLARAIRVANRPWVLSQVLAAAGKGRRILGLGSVWNPEPIQMP
jgi:glycosyltransferase involved in cell wall biosynthesis